MDIEDLLGVCATWVLRPSLSLYRYARFGQLNHNPCSKHVLDVGSANLLCN
jgi:hypothetical protein